MKLVCVKQNSIIYFHNRLNFSNGRIFTIEKGKVFELHVVKVLYKKSESDAAFIGYIDSSKRLITNSFLPLKRNNEALDNNSTFVNGEYYTPEFEIFTAVDGSTDTKLSRYEKNNELEFDYLFVFINNKNYNDFFVPNQKMTARSVEKEEEKMFENRKALVQEIEATEKEFVFNTLQEMIEEAVNEVKKEEITDDELDELRKEQDDKITAFNEPKYFKLEIDGNLIIAQADGINTENNEYIGLNLATMTALNFKESDIQLEISKETADAEASAIKSENNPPNENEPVL